MITDDVVGKDCGAVVRGDGGEKRSGGVVLNEAQWDELFRVGLGAARRLNVPRCDEEDCALEFAYHMACLVARRGARGVAEGPGAADPPAYCHRCAVNYARRFHRRIRRDHFRNAGGITPVTASGAEADAWEDSNHCYSDYQPCLSTFVRRAATPPLDLLFSREWVRRVEHALDGLTPAQRTAFERCALLGEAASEVAGAASATAVASALARARRSLRTCLGRQGYGPDWLGIACPDDGNRGGTNAPMEDAR